MGRGVHLFGSYPSSVHTVMPPQPGKQDILNVLDMAEIAIYLSGEMAESAEEWADLFKAAAEKGAAE